MAQMRKDSWDDSLPLNIITCLLRSFRCYAYSFAAPHCFSQSWFISGTPAHLHLQVRFGDLDEDSQGKSIGPWWWFATQTLGNEWKAWSMSLWELIQTSSNNWIQTCFWVWERMVQLWFAVALTGIIPYHTVGALQKKALGSQTCFRRWSRGVKRLSARSLPGDANDAIRIYCKTI